MNLKKQPILVPLSFSRKRESIVSSFWIPVFTGMTLCILACLSGSVRAGTYSGGEGEPNEPYLIETAEDLNDISNHIEDFNKCFLMVADINLGDYTGTQFNIIGEYPDEPFTGVFDGNGHKIFNFAYTATDASFVGIFGYVDGADSVIRDLTLIDPNINAKGYSYFVGSLVGRLYLYGGMISGCSVAGGSVSGYRCTGGLAVSNSGTVLDCYANVSVSGLRDYTGGLVGENWFGTIENCYSIGEVSGYILVGGLAGINCEGTISNCYSNSSVYGDESIGGLVGYGDRGTISNSYATGHVSGGDYFAGGLMGYNRGAISGCYATGNVSGDCSIGGLVGNNKDGTISNCHATGVVDGNSCTGGLAGEIDGGVISSCYATGSVTGSWRTGGLAGENAGTILNCYETGDITGEYWWAGGLVGDNYYGTIQNCYAIGSVTGSWNVGGLVGENRMGDPVLSSFWDIETSGQQESDGGTGKTTVEMQTENTYTDSGWDFIEIWNIGENQTYPFLRAYPPGDIDHDSIVNFYDLAILADHWLEGTP